MCQSRFYILIKTIILYAINNNILLKIKELTLATLRLNKFFIDNIILDKLLYVNKNDIVKKWKKKKHNFRYTLIVPQEADPLKSDLKKNKKGLASVILAAKPISRFGTCYNTYKWYLCQ